MSAPTPGPWWASGSDFAVLAGDADDKPYTRTVAETNVGDMTEAEALANARLIAAAPDLLRACMDLVAGIDVDCLRQQFGAFYEEACAAIAKAHGSQGYGRAASEAAIAKAEGKS